MVIEYKTKISTLRGDYREADDGTIGNRLRLWDKARLQATTRRHLPGASLLRSVDAPEEEAARETSTSSALSQPRIYERERIVEDYVAAASSRLADQGLGTGYADRSRRAATISGTGLDPSARLDATGTICSTRDSCSLAVWSIRQQRCAS